MENTKYVLGILKQHSIPNHNYEAAGVVITYTNHKYLR